MATITRTLHAQVSSENIFRWMSWCGGSNCAIEYACFQSMKNAFLLVRTCLCDWQCFRMTYFLGIRCFSKRNFNGAVQDFQRMNISRLNWLEQCCSSAGDAFLIFSVCNLRSSSRRSASIYIYILRRFLFNKRAGVKRNRWRFLLWQHRGCQGTTICTRANARWLFVHGSATSKVAGREKDKGEYAMQKKKTTFRTILFTMVNVLHLCEWKQDIAISVLRSDCRDDDACGKRFLFFDEKKGGWEEKRLRIH